MSSKSQSKKSRANNLPTLDLRPIATRSTRAQQSANGDTAQKVTATQVTTRRGKKGSQELEQTHIQSKPVRKRPEPTRTIVISETGSQFHAVHIDVDEESSEEERPPRKKAKPLNSAAIIETCQREEEESSEPESEDADDDDMQDDSPINDRNALQHLDDEAVIFPAVPSKGKSKVVDVNKDVVNNVEEPLPARSRHRVTQPSQSSSQNATGKGEDMPIASRGAGVSNLPLVSAETLPISRTAKVTLASTRHSVQTAVEVHSEPIWLKHTNIVVSGKSRSSSLALTGQPPVMHSIIERAISLGKVKILFDHSFSPVDPSGLKQIAFAALNKVAEQDGLDGQGDVCHRLAEGDNNTYIKPLVSYVSHRIGLERHQLKDLFALILSSFGLSSVTGPGAATDLVHKRTYFYPLIDEASDGTPKFNHKKPFEHPVFSAFISAAFFSTSTYSRIVGENSNLFRSSLSGQHKRHELEVPKAMVALASVTIHACLQDFATGVKENFPSRELDGIWHLAIDLLNGIEKLNRVRYHNLMHNFYKDATQSLSTHSMTNQQVYDAVDWSAIAQDCDNEVGPQAQGQAAPQQISRIAHASFSSSSRRGRSSSPVEPPPKSSSPGLHARSSSPAAHSDH
ncbi:hypothetical protein EV360DRAFT_73703 [Lentinula raphanica]|nr:hypothetical protein EV360DRAFT_73703 [Lentinula raphanica]